MLSFSLIADALTGLIYHRPSGENFSFVVALKSKTFSNQRASTIIRLCNLMRKPPRLTMIRRNFLPKVSKETFRVTILIQTTSMRSISLEDNYEYFYPPEDPDDYRSDMDDDHDLVADIDSDTLIVNFLKRGKAPGPDNIHNGVLRLGTTTSLFHHLARLFKSSIQIGYIPTA